MVKNKGKYLIYIIIVFFVLLSLICLNNMTKYVNSTPKTGLSKINENIGGIEESFFYEVKNEQFRMYPHNVNQYIRLLKTNCLCNKIVIGDLYTDGYKIGCSELFQKDCIVYSLGSNGDFAYEKEIYKKFGCKVFTIDKDYFIPPSYVSFQKEKIGNCENCKTIKEIISNNNHTNKEISAFKIDIEGFEWELLDEIFNDNFKQIQIEIHAPKYENIKKLNSFSKDWCLVDVNPNILAPQCYELVFLNKKYI